MDEDNRKHTLEPPKDIEAEMAILGAMLKSQDARMDVNGILHAEDFYLKEHQEIYRTMLDMEQRSVGIDITTVYSALKHRKTADMIGGITYLSRLMDDAIVVSNAKYYADIVINKSRMRQLIAESERIRESAYSDELPAEDILDHAEQTILEIAQKSQKSQYEDVNDVLFENIKEIQLLEKTGGKTDGIDTGYRDVDYILQGLHKSDLVILAARPGVGKTAWALNVATNAVMEGKTCMIFSLEMSDLQLGERLLSMSSSVELTKIRAGDLTADEWDNLSAAKDSFYMKNMVIDDTSSITPMEIKNKCRRYKQEKGSLDLVVIDYLQLMSMGGYRVEQREKEIGAMTRALKIMAKELDCAVLLLSQLSRGPEQRGGDHMPKLSDLRDSGSIEQDADIVIFLKREDYYMETDERAETEGNAGLTCIVNIAKHRAGPTGQATLAWLPKYVKFGNLASQRDIDQGY